jgi:hypothetical protein
MDLKLFALATCLLIGGTCAQDNLDYNTHYTGLAGIGSSMNSTELISLPRLDASLQTLIDGASDGSSITIDRGRYVLSAPLHISKNITLIGTPLVYIDAQGNSQILQIDNPKVSVNMEKLLFIHGKGEYGGAINSQAKSLTIKDCDFSDGLADYGAAIYQNRGNLTIKGSSFQRNDATGYGAAIYDEGGNITVESSTFTQNPGSYVLYIDGTQPMKSNVSIKNYNVSNNPGPYNTLNSGFGGAIVCQNSTALIDRCTIKGNRALINQPTALSGANAGLSVSSSNVTVNNTLIYGNEALYSPAVYIGGGSKARITHCIIAKNHALSVLYDGKYEGGDNAGVTIAKGAEVTIDDVSIEDNIADVNSNAISNAGILDLNGSAIITRNTAKNHSAVDNAYCGTITIHKDVHISDNRNVHKPGRPIHSEGIMNQGVP